MTVNILVEIKRFNVTHPHLRNYINFYWVIQGNYPSINHKMLPVRNIDLILNFASNLEYDNGIEGKKFSAAHFLGLNNKFNFYWKKPSGYVDIIGISFNPTGFYPLLEIPVSEYKNCIIDLELLNKPLANELVEKASPLLSIQNRLLEIEKVLLNKLKKQEPIGIVDQMVFKNLKSINSEFRLKKFCDKNGIHERKLERLFNKYVGTNPKSYLRLCRFQKTLRQIVDRQFENMSDLVYHNGYYDQMHFIKDFKTFTGASPTNFIKKKPSLQDISYFT